MKKYLFLIICYCLSAFIASAQDIESLKKHISAVNEHFRNLNYSMPVYYSLYNKTISGKPFQYLEYKFSRYNGMSRTESEHADTYSNKEYRLSVYKKSKQIVLNNPRSRKINATISEEDLLTLIDSASRFVNKVEFITDTSFSGAKYMVYLSPNLYKYSKYSVSIDTVRNVLKEIVIYYSENLTKTLGNPLPASPIEKDFIPVLVVKLGSVKELSPSDVSMFYASDIIIKSKKKYILTERYSNYQFQDFISK